MAEDRMEQQIMTYRDDPEGLERLSPEAPDRFRAAFDGLFTAREEDGAMHVAIIMDGNGRWAAARGLVRERGHEAGAAAVRRIVEAAPTLGIRVLTLYAFSSDNWQRPRREVEALMRLFRCQLGVEGPRCVSNGVRLQVIGRRDRLPGPLRKAIRHVEAQTASGERLHLRLAVDYSARDAILRAAAWPGIACDREAFARALGAAYGADEPAPEPAPDVDLLIRTGGERRLSDFLLWECAYAELLFIPRLWPDFDAGDLEAAMADFHRRERRFGGLPRGAGTAAAGGEERSLQPAPPSSMDSFRKV